MSSSLFLQYHFYYIPFFSLCQISFFFWTHFQSSLYIGTALYSNVYRHILAFIVMIYYTIIEIHLTILSNQNQQTQTSFFSFQRLSNLIIRDFSRRSCNFWKHRKQKKCRKAFAGRLKNSWDIMIFKRQQTYTHTWMTKTFLEKTSSLHF